MTTIAPEGFREYDLRWRYPEQIDCPGMRQVGLAFGHWLHEANASTQVVIGRDSRSHSPQIQQALTSGLIATGCQVIDLGLTLTPLLYFAQIVNGKCAGVMVTASHNPKEWTGLKLSATPPLTLGPDEIQQLRAFVYADEINESGEGVQTFSEGIKETYTDLLVENFSLTKPLKVVCATGNGTAGVFAPQLLAGIGCEVVPRHTELDDTFPHYTPNPEAAEMLTDMGDATRDTGAAIGLGFDGDGDRCGAVDETGTPVFSDKLGLLLARRFAVDYPKSLILADIKSTSLFESDPVLREHDCRFDYVRTGHAYMKQEMLKRHALLGVERAGHFYFGPPIGDGYDDGLRAAIEICRLLDQSGSSLSSLVAQLPQTWASPTYQPTCADAMKYDVVSRVTQQLQGMQETNIPFAGEPIRTLLTINGVRVVLENGDWTLIRASSNTPNLVVMAESHRSESRMQEICDSARELLVRYPNVDCTVMTQ